VDRSLDKYVSTWRVYLMNVRSEHCQMFTDCQTKLTDLVTLAVSSSSTIVSVIYYYYYFYYFYYFLLFYIIIIITISSSSSIRFTSHGGQKST